MSVSSYCLPWPSNFADKNSHFFFFFFRRRAGRTGGISYNMGEPESGRERKATSAVRTAPVRGAPPYPCTPLKMMCRSSKSIHHRVDHGVSLGEPTIDDPLRNTLYQILDTFLLLKMIVKPARSGYSSKDGKNAKNKMVILVFSVL